MILYSFHTLQSCLHYKPHYLLISEASQTHSLTMNSQSFTLSETLGPVTFWVSVGNGKETIASTWLLNAASTEQNNTRWFSWPLQSLLLCSGSLLGNIYSPGIPRSERHFNCFRVLFLNTWMLFLPVRGNWQTQIVVQNPFQKHCHRVALWRHDRKSPRVGHMVPLRMAGLQRNLFL